MGKQLFLFVLIVAICLMFFGCDAETTSPNPITDYVALAQNTSYEISVSLQKIGNMIAQYPNITSFPASIWGQVKAVKDITAKMVGADAPVGLEQIHSSMVAGCERYSWAMDLLKEAAQGSTLNYSKVEEAISLMDSGKDYFVIANSFWPELVQSPSLLWLSMADYVASYRLLLSSTRSQSPNMSPKQAPLNQIKCHPTPHPKEPAQGDGHACPPRVHEHPANPVLSNSASPREVPDP